jgi:hypothetical protein
MSLISQTPVSGIATLQPMSEPIRIVTVAGDGEDGLFVTFSDGTIAVYLVEEQIDLMPCREHGKGLKGPFSFFHSTVRLARPKKCT